MRAWAAWGFLAVFLPVGALATMPAPVPAPVPVPVRIGRHTDFTRIVFDFSKRVHVSLVRQANDRAILELPAGTEIENPPHLLPGLRGMRRVQDGEELNFAPGATLHRMQLGNRVVVDIMDAGDRSVAARRPQPEKGRHAAKDGSPGAPFKQAGAEHKSASVPILTPAPIVAVADVGLMPTVSPAASAAPAPTGLAPPAPPPSPLPAGVAPLLAIAAVPVPSDGDGSAMVVPLGKQVGAAAFRRGAFGLVVFDERQPVDLSALHSDPLLGEARVVLIPDGTLLRIPLPRSMAIGLKRVREGWRVSVQQARMPATALTLTVAAGALAAAGPGAHDVLSIADPLSGTTLLVGTEQEAGRGVRVARRTPQYRLLSSWQGFVVQPLSDALALRTAPDGFHLTGGMTGLAASDDSTIGQEMAGAAHLTREFDFPDRSLPELEQQLQDRLDAAAAAPSLARGRPRRAVAQAMIALGMGAEAAGVLRLAAAQDPREAASPAHGALMAIANILAGRPALDPGARDPLADPALSGFDDIALWRALRKAMLDPGAPDAAAILGITTPLIGTWPAPMRDRVLPLAVETMIGGGEAKAAARMVDARPNDRGLDFARGMLKQNDGDTNAALAVFDRLARSPDRKLHARAAVRAINIRLAAGRIDAAHAANALDRLMYAWRGGRRERLLRQELAKLRAQSGEWRTALTLLRRTQALFPNDRSAVQGELRQIFAAMLDKEAPDRMASLDLVALVDDDADLLPSGAAGEALEARLADRLMALDLPDRAEPLLRKLMMAAPTSGGRATFGARLAAIRLRQGDAAGAQRALAESAAAGLRPKLAHRRALLAARIEAKQGHPQDAANMLAVLATPQADAARASILEDAHDWAGAEKALTAYAAKTIPASGPINDAQRRTLLHLATAAAQAGDAATLASLRTHDTARMTTGPLADLFALLTAAPVQTVADLGRSAREATIAGKLTGDLRALPNLGP